MWDEKRRGDGLGFRIREEGTGSRLEEMQRLDALTHSGKRPMVSRLCFLCPEPRCASVRLAFAFPGHGFPSSLPPAYRCQYMRISEILPSLVSQKIAPRASTHSPVRRRRKVQRNSVANHGPASKISPDLKLTSA